MDTKREIQEGLTSRRATITPEQAGAPSYGARRVPGLRREGVAVLAGVSVPHYTRLERGDLSGVSEERPRSKPPSRNGRPVRAMSSANPALVPKAT